MTESDGGQGSVDPQAHRVQVEERRAARERELWADTSRVRTYLADAGHGPRYFPIDATYRVPVALEAAPDGARVRRERTTGEEDEFALVGMLRGSVNDQPVALEATRTLVGEIRVTRAALEAAADTEL